MKILLIHYNAAPPGQAGGAESAIRDQQQALQALGHDVRIEYDNPQRAWSRWCPDVVHVHTVHVRLGLSVLARLQRVGIPHVLSLHDYWPFCEGRMLLKAGTFAMSTRAENCAAVDGLCDGVCDSAPTEPEVLELVNGSPVVTFNATSAAIMRRHGVDVAAVIPHGIDTALFAPPTEPRGEPAIVTVSAWPHIPTKGMHVLREALALTGLKAKLVTGKPRSEVRDWLQMSTIMVFPSCYQETWGLCLTEAMACGCACVASDVAGPRAQIKHGVTGMLFPNGDAKALAEQLRTLWDDPGEVARMGGNARRWAETHASLERMARDYEALYRRVMGAA